MKHYLVACFALMLSAGSVMAEGFPVTVKHVFGQTEIVSEPRRVLSLGRNDQDFLYALGVAPIGVREWWGGQEYATWPWAEEARLSLAATPKVLTSPEENFEWIAQTRPDLIVAIYEDLTREQYALLSKIAPVVMRPPGYEAWLAPWQEQLRQTSLAVTGGTRAAEGIISELEEDAASLRAAYPILEGKTASLADFREGQVTLWAKGHAPTRFLESLGMVFPDSLNARADAAGWIYISPENLELIDLDVLVWPNGHQDALESLAVFTNLRQHKEGRSVFLPGSTNTLAAALWFQTPLSLRYAMGEIVPMLADALDGDRATKVKIPQ